jgi:hypothetical protein
VRPGGGLLDNRRARDRQVRDLAQRAVGLEAGGGVGGEHRAGEVGAGDLGRGEGEWIGQRPDGEVHDLDVDGVEGTVADTEEEMGRGGGRGRCGGREGEGLRVAARCVRLGFHGGGRGQHAGKGGDLVAEEREGEVVGCF